MDVANINKERYKAAKIARLDTKKKKKGKKGGGKTYRQAASSKQ